MIFVLWASKGSEKRTEVLATHRDSINTFFKKMLIQCSRIGEIQFSYKNFHQKRNKQERSFFLTLLTWDLIEKFKLCITI